MANYQKGKLTVTGAANILTDLNPSAFYSNNGNYLKFVVYVDWNGNGANRYLFSGDTNWFTVENYTNGGIYFNMGDNAVGLGSGVAVNTQEFSKPMTVVLNNGTATFEQDGNTDTKSFTALAPTTFTFWRSNNGYNFDGDFCGFEVYSDATTLVHNYIPWKDVNDNPCIVDTVTDNVFYPSGSSYTMTYTALETFEADKYELDFDYQGGTDTLTVTADNSWSCTTPTGFSLSPTSGTTGETTVTVTTGHSGTEKTGTAVFTDSNSNTFDVALTQSGDGSLFPFAKIIQGTRRIN